MTIHTRTERLLVAFFAALLLLLPIGSLYTVVNAASARQIPTPPKINEFVVDHVGVVVDAAAVTAYSPFAVGVNASTPTAVTLNTIQTNQTNSFWFMALAGLLFFLFIYPHQDSIDVRPPHQVRTEPLTCPALPNSIIL